MGLDNLVGSQSFGLEVFGRPSFFKIMQDERIKNLPDDEFHELAISQSKKFPGLLELITEEEIIYEFYQYYKRKLPKQK